MESNKINIQTHADINNDDDNDRDKRRNQKKKKKNKKLRKVERIGVSVGAIGGGISSTASLGITGYVWYKRKKEKKYVFSFRFFLN